LPKEPLPKFCALIPVYNDRDSVLALTEKIAGQVGLPIIVINDGSADGLCLADFSVPVIYREHRENRGKGAALKNGLARAAELGFQYAITLDADGQHAPEIIPDFISVISATSGPVLVVGKRDLLTADMPLHRRLSNNITSLMLSLRTGLRIYDSQVGYRCYPLYDSRLWNIHEDGFQFESAVFLILSKLAIRLEWVSIPVLYGNTGSHMRLVADTLKFIRTMVRSFLW